MTWDPYAIPEAQEALDAFAVQLQVQGADLQEVLRYLTLEIARAISDQEKALSGVTQRLNRVISGRLRSQANTIQPALDSVNQAIAGELESQSVRVATLSADAAAPLVEESGGLGTAAPPNGHSVPLMPPEPSPAVMIPPVEGGVSVGIGAETPSTGRSLIGAGPDAGPVRWVVLRSPDLTTCAVAREDQAGFYPTWTVVSTHDTQEQATAALAQCSGAAPPPIPPLPPPPQPGPAPVPQPIPPQPPPQLPPPTAPPPVVIPPTTPPIPPTPLPGCPQLPAGAVGSAEFCNAIEDWKRYFRTVGQTLLSLLSTGGEFAPSEPAGVADWILSAFGVSAQTATAVVNLLTQTQYGVDFSGVVRRWYDTVTCAVRCDPALYIGIAFARTLLDLLDSFRIGVNLAVVGTLEVRVRLDQATRVVDYLLNHACPTEIPSVAEVHELYLRGEVSESHARCLVEMLGLEWELQEKVIRIKRSRPNPLEVIQLYMRGEIDRDEFDERMRSHGYLDQRDAALEARLQQQIPPLSDLPRFMTRDVEDPLVVQRYQLDAEFERKFAGRLRYWAAAQGIPEDYMRYVWRAHWVYPSNTQLFEMLHRLRPGRVPDDVAVTEEMVAEVLGINDLAPVWRQRVMATSYNPLTRVDTQRAYFIGALSEEDLYNSYRDQRYNDDNARKLVEFTKRLKLLRVADHHWTKLYIQGAITREEAVRRLTSDGFTEEEISFGLGLAELRHVGSLRRKWNLKAANQYVESLIKAYKAGTLARPDFVRQLVQIGWSNDSATIKADAVDIEARTSIAATTVSRIGRSVERGDVSLAEADVLLDRLGIVPQRRQELLAGFNLRLSSAARGATASQVVRWYKLGLIDEETALRRLANLGYPDAEASLLVAEAGLGLAQREAQARLAADRQQRGAAAEMERLVKAAEQQAERFRQQLRRLSPISKLQKWLKLGIINEEFFFRRAAAMGYPPEEAQRWYREALHGRQESGNGDGQVTEA